MVTMALGMRHGKLGTGCVIKFEAGLGMSRAEPSLSLEVNEPSRAYIPQLGHKPSRAEPMSRLGSGLGEPGSVGSVKCKGFQGAELVW